MATETTSGESRTKFEELCVFHGASVTVIGDLAETMVLGRPIITSDGHGRFLLAAEGEDDCFGCRVHPEQVVIADLRPEGAELALKQAIGAGLPVLLAGEPGSRGWVLATHDGVSVVSDGVSQDSLRLVEQARRQVVGVLRATGLSRAMARQAYKAGRASGHAFSVQAARDDLRWQAEQEASQAELDAYRIFSEKIRFGDGEFDGYGAERLARIEARKARHQPQLKAEEERIRAELEEALRQIEALSDEEALRDCRALMATWQH